MRNPHLLSLKDRLTTRQQVRRIMRITNRQIDRQSQPVEWTRPSFFQRVKNALGF